jgi:hypothetical protein
MNAWILGLVVARVLALFVTQCAPSIARQQCMLSMAGRVCDHHHVWEPTFYKCLHSCLVSNTDESGK